MKIGKANKGYSLFNSIIFVLLKFLMFFLYFFILTPISFLIRITGNDLLKLKF